MQDTTHYSVAYDNVATNLKPGVDVDAAVDFFKSLGCESIEVFALTERQYRLAQSLLENDPGTFNRQTLEYVKTTAADYPAADPRFDDDREEMET